MNIVTVSHLHKRFGEEHSVIRNLSFSLKQGQRLAIFAPSGSGKTTLLHILAKLQQPDSGNVWVEATYPVVIFQEPRLFPHLTVEENIFLPFQVQKKAMSEQNQKDYAAWLEVCELGKFRQHFPHELSGGMKQKVALVRGFLQKPALALLDEPFQSIGQTAKKGIIQHLLGSQPGLSMLLVTHDPDEVRLLADDALFFQNNYLGQYRLVQTIPTNFAPDGVETSLNKEIL